MGSVEIYYEAFWKIPKAETRQLCSVNCKRFYISRQWLPEGELLLADCMLKENEMYAVCVTLHV